MINPPRIKIAHLPTAIEPLPRLSEELGGPILYIKRDDQTGLAFGGNKARKLEFLVAEAKAHGAHTLITAGAAQSNHCRQTAASAARFGFKCKLVLAGETPKESSGNLLIDRLLGAEIIWTNNNVREDVLQETFDKAWKAGDRPYLIPYGGSNSIGATGYVYSIIELLDQISHDEITLASAPDWIVFASSSGGTQAGLIVGAELFGYAGRILGISVDEPAEILSSRVTMLANETSDHLQVDRVFTADQVLVNSDYLGGGYGVMGDKEIQAIELFARLEGILLDPVYTGKAAAGLINLIRNGYFRKDETVLFWHTGGTPALFATRYQAQLQENNRRKRVM
jgi:D-cysteine desulfhydrase family pyridoxal phosphate-dependent enzyme